MNKRAYDRMPSNILVRFYCGDTDYHGVITNISENGMFISTKQMSFPFDSLIELVVPLNEKLLRIPVKVCRMTKSRDVFDGIGVQLLDNHKGYLELVCCLRENRLPF